MTARKILKKILLIFVIIIAYAVGLVQGLAVALECDNAVKEEKKEEAEE